MLRILLLLPLVPEKVPPQWLFLNKTSKGQVTDGGFRMRGPDFIGMCQPIYWPIFPQNILFQKGAAPALPKTVKYNMKVFKI